MSQKGNNILLLISSLLFGSSLSLIFSNGLINAFNLRFLNPSIPGMSPELNIGKTFDITDFYLTLVLSLILFGINSFRKGSLAIFSLLIFALALFLQTHFVFYSAKHILTLFIVFELIYFALAHFDRKFAGVTEVFNSFSKKEVLLSFQNGVFLGFFTLLLTNNLTTIPLFSLMWLLFIPLLISSYAAKNLTSRFVHLVTASPFFVLVLAVINPTNLMFLTGLFITVLILSLIIYVLKNNFFQKDLFAKFINPALLVFLLAFNPVFFIGSFDSVEEGFWLGWIQRLSLGETLYKDVAVYHPPLLTWGMYLFSKISGFSIYSERLFLHLLQVAGAVIYFFFTKRLTKNIYFALASLILFLSFTSNDLRNNVEIRVGMGLLGLLFFFKFLDVRKKLYLILSGVVSCISLLVSFEVGLAVIITLSLVSILLTGRKLFSLEKIKNLSLYYSGILIIVIPFFTYLLITGALSGFIEQSYFYASAFSQGYFSSALERSFLQSFFQFHLFDEYLSSNALFWEITKLTFGGFLIFIIFKKFQEKNLDTSLYPLIITSLFGLILMRASLGRSDLFHLLFVLVIAFAVLFSLLSKLYTFNRTLSLTLALIFLLVLSRPWVNSSFLQKTFYKAQTYGRIVGEYKDYNFERGKRAQLSIDADNGTMNDLVRFITSNTSSEEKIFIYPWNPEVYFYSNRKNATSFDTPYAFFSQKYQDQMVGELKHNNPKFIIYSPNRNFGGLTPNSLKSVNEHINANFTKKETFGPFEILVKN